jgi:hypothetical protein
MIEKWILGFDRAALHQFKAMLAAGHRIRCGTA